MENIHVAKLEASLLNTVKQHVTVQMAAVMGGHVHDDHRFFTLRFFNNRFWLYNGLRLNVRGRSTVAISMAMCCLTVFNRQGSSLAI